MSTTKKVMSRRDLLGTAMKGSILLALPVLQVACGKKELACTDTAGMSFDDAATRTNLVYVDKAADPARSCEKCQLFKPAAPDACGACNVVKGPINPGGSCNAFAAKQA